MAPALEAQERKQRAPQKSPAAPKPPKQGATQCADKRARWFTFHEALPRLLPCFPSLVRFSPGSS